MAQWSPCSQGDTMGPFARAGERGEKISDTPLVHLWYTSGTMYLNSMAESVHASITFSTASTIRVNLELNRSPHLWHCAIKYIALVNIVVRLNT